MNITAERPRVPTFIDHCQRYIRRSRGRGGMGAAEAGVASNVGAAKRRKMTVRRQTMVRRSDGKRRTASQRIALQKIDIFCRRKRCGRLLLRFRASSIPSFLLKCSSPFVLRCVAFHAIVVLTFQSPFCLRSLDFQAIVVFNVFVTVFVT